MFTPASDFETGSSRTVTSRDHPPLYVRLFASENGYLNTGTRLSESVVGGHAASGFCASTSLLAGPGSLVDRSWELNCVLSWPRAGKLASDATPATASAPDPASKKFRRVTFSSFASCPMTDLLGA